MRIAFVLGDFPALSETFVLNQITGLLDRGHELEIFAERPRAEDATQPDIDGYELLARTTYEHMPARAARALRAPAALAAARRSRCLRVLDVRRYGLAAASLRLLYAAQPFLGRPPYDAVHCHFVANGLKAALLRDAGALRGPLVVTVHGRDIGAHLGLYGPRASRLLLEQGDLFLPVSDRWNDRLAALGCDPAKIVTHRMGIDLRSFGAGPRADGEGLRIVTVGRLVETKGIEDGIRAVALLAREGRVVNYVVVGDGPLRGRLQQAIQELGARDSITLLGARTQPEVIALLRAADIFLAPNVTARNGDKEGVPVAVVEAMASRLPVVGTRHSGIPELVRDEETGFLVPEGDVAALAARLRLLLGQRELAHRLGEEGRRRVAAEFDIEGLNDRLVELYEGVTAKGVRR